MEGYLRKLKTNKRRFFVLQTGSADAKPCLECYESEKKYATGAFPSKKIFLEKILKVCRLQEKRHPYAFVVCTEDEKMGLVADSENDLFRWFDAIEHEQGEVFVNAEDIRLLYSKSWHILVKARGIAVTKSLHGAYDMCLAQSHIYFTDATCGKVKFSVSYMSVRKCGYTENKLYFEVSADDDLGPGEVWIEAVDDKEAEDILHQLNRLTRRYRRTSSDLKVDQASALLPRSVSEEPVTITDLKKSLLQLTRAVISDLGPSSWARSMSGDSGVSSRSSSEFHIEENASSPDTSYQWTVLSGRRRSSDQSTFESSSISTDTSLASPRNKVKSQSSFDKEVVPRGRQVPLVALDCEVQSRKSFQRQKSAPLNQATKFLDSFDIRRVSLQGNGEQPSQPLAGKSFSSNCLQADEHHYKLLFPTAKLCLHKTREDPEPMSFAGSQGTPHSSRPLERHSSTTEITDFDFSNTYTPLSLPPIEANQIDPLALGGSYYKNLSFKDVNGSDRNDVSSNGEDGSVGEEDPSGNAPSSNLLATGREEKGNLSMVSKEGCESGPTRDLRGGWSSDVGELTGSIIERDSGSFTASPVEEDISRRLSLKRWLSSASDGNFGTVMISELMTKPVAGDVGNGIGPSSKGSALAGVEASRFSRSFRTDPILDSTELVYVDMKGVSGDVQSLTVSSQSQSLSDIGESSRLGTSNSEHVYESVDGIASSRCADLTPNEGRLLSCSPGGVTPTSRSSPSSSGSTPDVSPRMKRKSNRKHLIKEFTSHFRSSRMTFTGKRGDRSFVDVSEGKENADGVESASLSPLLGDRDSPGTDGTSAEDCYMDPEALHKVRKCIVEESDYGYSKVPPALPQPRQASHRTLLNDGPVDFREHVTLRRPSDLNAVSEEGTATVVFPKAGSVRSRNIPLPPSHRGPDNVEPTRHSAPNSSDVSDTSRLSTWSGRSSPEKKRSPRSLRRGSAPVQLIMPDFAYIPQRRARGGSAGNDLRANPTSSAPEYSTVGPAVPSSQPSTDPVVNPRQSVKQRSREVYSAVMLPRAPELLNDESSVTYETIKSPSLTMSETIVGNGSDPVASRAGSIKTTNGKVRSYELIPSPRVKSVSESYENTDSLMNDDGASQTHGSRSEGEVIYLNSETLNYELETEESFQGVEVGYESVMPRPLFFADQADANPRPVRRCYENTRETVSPKSREGYALSYADISLTHSAEHMTEDSESVYENRMSVQVSRDDLLYAVTDDVKSASVDDKAADVGSDTPTVGERLRSRKQLRKGDATEYTPIDIVKSQGVANALKGFRSAPVADASRSDEYVTDLSHMTFKPRLS